MKFTIKGTNFIIMVKSQQPQEKFHNKPPGEIP